MKKRYIIGATAAVISAGFMVEMQVGSTSLGRVEIVEDQMAAAAGTAAGSAPSRRDDAAAGGAGASGAGTATDAPAATEMAAADDDTLIGSTGLSDAQLLLADTSPWSDVASRGRRGRWQPMVPGAMVPGMQIAGAMPDQFDLVGQDSSGYALAGPVNAASGDDALAVALSQPVMFSTVPEPANWISLIVGLALVGYSLRRRNRLPNVSC